MEIETEVANEFSKFLQILKMKCIGNEFGLQVEHRNDLLCCNVTNNVACPLRARKV
jgi:hypothetical protein